MYEAEAGVVLFTILEQNARLFVRRTRPKLCRTKPRLYAGIKLAFASLANITVE